MLDRVARLPGAPCLLARGTWLGGIAFYHVNGSCRAIPVCRDEINHEDMTARGEVYRGKIDVTDESQAENRPVFVRAAESFSGRSFCLLWHNDLTAEYPGLHFKRDLEK